MSSKEAVAKEDTRVSTESGLCDFCGCKILDDQITMWSGDNCFHTECFQINSTKGNDQKENGVGIIISNVKIIDPA